MKKMFFAAMMLLVATVSMNSANVITMGDSIRIKPAKLDGYTHHSVVMHNEAYCDAWNMNVSYPDGLMVKLVSGITPLDGMTIPYINRYGEAQVYEAPLNVSAAYATIGSTITERGYWDIDEDGLFDSYGTVKWAPGAHNLFEFNFYVHPEFRGGYVIFDGRITSGADERGAILSDVRIYKKCWMWVGYKPGDVNGSERYDVGDVTDIIAYILGKDVSLDEFGYAALDANRDGIVNVADATDVIAWTLAQ
jgi:hypothetical protein